MANDRQISQLVLQVDAATAVAQRNLQELARAVNQSATQMNTSLASNDAAIGRTMTQHHQLGLAFNNSRIAQMELTHVVTASVDSYAAGASPLRILTLEMGRLAEAATFLGGAGGGGVLGKVASFMGGPWGIAVLLGVNVLAQLIGKHLEAGESVDALVDKMRKQAQQAAANREANVVWASSLDGVTEALRANAEALDKLEKGEQDAATKALAAALSSLERLKGIRAETLANIELARSMLEVQKVRAQQFGEKGDLAAMGVGQRIAALDTFQSTLSNIDAQIAVASEQIRRATLDVYADEAKKDSADLIKQHYDELIRKAQQRAQAEHLTGVELQKQIILLKQQEAAEIKAIEAKNKPHPSGEFGKQIGFSDAEAIARNAGLTVTSGYRSEAKQAELYRTVRTPENPVARPGTSAHQGVNGKWALDIAFAPGLTADKLKKLYGDQGVSLSAVYKETGHFHIEGSRSQAASAENAAARAAQKQLTDNDQFAKESAQLDAEILQARKVLAAGYDTQAKYADDEIDAQKQELLAAIQKQVDGKQITAAQGKILSAKVEEVASAKKAVVDQRAYLEALAQSAKAVDQALGFQEEDLRFADDMATTQHERRKLELQIIDIVYQRKQAELEALKQRIEANADFATSAALQKDAANIQAQIDRLPTERAQDQSRARLQTQDPLEAWARQVPHTAAQINEALQSIEVQGIDNLASSIADVITGTKSLGDAFKSVAGSIIQEIIQMTVKMLIFKAISSFAGGLGGGGGGGDVGAFNTVMDGGIPGFASGGSMLIGGNGGVDNNQLSMNGKPIARVSQGETLAVIPPRMNLSGAANSNGPIELRLVVDTSENLDAKVDAKVVGGMQQAVRLSVSHTNNTLRSMTRPHLMGGR